MFSVPYSEGSNYISDYYQNSIQLFCHEIHCHLAEVMFQRTLRLVQPAKVSLQSNRTMSAATAVKDIGMKVTSNAKALLASGVLSELRPPSPGELPTAIRDLVRLFTQRNWQNVTVRDAWRNTLVTTEVICWFFVGECIGKGTLIGYQV